METRPEAVEGTPPAAEGAAATEQATQPEGTPPRKPTSTPKRANSRSSTQTTDRPSSSTSATSGRGADRGKRAPGAGGKAPELKAVEERPSQHPSRRRSVANRTGQGAAEAGIPDAERSRHMVEALVTAGPIHFS
jgi:hypothetical protein